MEKIARKELKYKMLQAQLPVSKIEEMQPIDVYHSNNWDNTIKHWDEDSRRNENPPLREFYFDMKDMVAFLTDYLNTMFFKEVILASLCGGRLVGIPYTKDYTNCVDEMTNWLHANNMRINSSAGLLLTEQELMSCIGMISECGFMGMSGLNIFIPEAGIAIIVHHHMNYLIYCNSFEEQRSIIKEIISSQKNVIMFSESHNG